MQRQNGRRRNCWSVALLLLLAVAAQGSERRALRFPNIPGFVTLVCDFHLHTVFSDGTVWPTVRVEEAWREGLDVIAITEHLEARHHRAEVSGSSNTSFEKAAGRAQELGIILIRGAEITRSMPPGHFNAIFVKDADALAVDDWRQAIGAAIAQGAFVFWNHPGWRQPGTIPVWYEEHGELYQKGWLHGIEVVNAREYYPQVQAWCAEKHLTLLGNSDAHDPMALEYNFAAGEHRPLTLVFARRRTAEDIEAALRARRTVVYWGNLLIGDAAYLQALFAQGVKVVNQPLVIASGRSAELQVHNSLPLSLELAAIDADGGLSVPERLVLPSERTTLIRIRLPQSSRKGLGTFHLHHRVDNMRVAPGQGLAVSISAKLRVIELSQR